MDSKWCIKSLLWALNEYILYLDLAQTSKDACLLWMYTVSASWQELQRRFSLRLCCPPKTVWEKWTNSVIMQWDIWSFELLKCWMASRPNTGLYWHFGMHFVTTIWWNVRGTLGPLLSPKLSSKVIMRLYLYVWICAMTARWVGDQWCQRPPWLKIFSFLGPVVLKMVYLVFHV